MLNNQPSANNLQTQENVLSMQIRKFLATLLENNDTASFNEKLENFISAQASTPEERTQLSRKLIHFSLSRPYLFLKIWETLQSNVVLEDLYHQIQDQNKKNKTILWALALFAGFLEKPQVFLQIWEKFKGEIKLVDLLIPAQGGQFGSTTGLWLLANNGEVFLKVWEKFKDEIRLADLLTPVQEGKYKGMSALWLLAYAASHGKPEAFLNVWEKVKAQVTLTPLLAQAQESPNKGLSILWDLACYAASGHPEIFLNVWERFQDELTLADLRTSPIEGLNKDLSALWLLACAASHDRLEVFQKVWEKFQGEMTLADLLTTSSEGPTKGHSALSMLCRKYPELAKKILQQAPGIISDVSMVGDALGNSLTANNLMPLVQARNTFFRNLAQIQPQSLSQNRLMLLEEARKAYDAGYLNAFYDVGELLFLNQHYMAAYHAYKEVPPTSCHFEKINLKLAEHHFSQVVSSPIENTRQFHLRESLRHALQTNDSVRIELIQRIAFRYTGCDEIGVRNIVPNGLIDAMNSETSLDWCFERLDEIKAKITLEKENKALKEEMKGLKQRAETAEKAVAALLATNKAPSSNFADSLEEPASLLVAFSQQKSTHSAKRKDGPLLEQGATPASKEMRSNSLA